MREWWIRHDDLLATDRREHLPRTRDLVHKRPDGQHTLARLHGQTPESESIPTNRSVALPSEIGSESHGAKPDSSDSSGPHETRKSRKS
jgi:hypothetical protein